MTNSEIDLLLKKASIDLPVLKSESLKQKLVMQINDLLLNNFEQLVQLLYTIDVDENKLKKLLQDHPQTDAAVLLAELLLQRQVEKIKAKQSFSSSNNIAEEDKW